MGTEIITCCMFASSMTRSIVLEREARVHPIGQVQRTSAAGVGDDQVDEPTAFGDFQCKAPRLLAQAHDRAFGCQSTVNINLKLYARISCQKSGLRPLAK